MCRGTHVRGCPAYGMRQTNVPIARLVATPRAVVGHELEPCACWATCVWSPTTRVLMHHVDVDEIPRFISPSRTFKQTDGETPRGRAFGAARVPAHAIYCATRPSHMYTIQLNGTQTIPRIQTVARPSPALNSDALQSNDTISLGRGQQTSRSVRCTK